jgi:hypothetical protein
MPEMMRSTLRTLTFFFVFITGFTHGQDSSSDQRQYNLFNPTPRDVMREFSIDRPDVTESPVTVDPGHFQFEGDLIKITGEDQWRGLRTINFVSALYKMGLTHSWDIHIGIEPFNYYDTRTGGEIQRDTGFGNTTIRLKHNFWGNDGAAKTALGIIPYITFLRGSNEQVYGFGIPFSVALTDKLDFGAQAQFDFVPIEDQHETSYFQTVVVGGELIGNLDFYAEGLVIIFQGDTFLSANGGLIYNIQRAYTLGCPSGFKRRQIALSDC